MRCMNEYVNTFNFRLWFYQIIKSNLGTHSELGICHLRSNVALSFWPIHATGLVRLPLISIKRILNSTFVVFALLSLEITTSQLSLLVSIWVKALPVLTRLVLLCTKATPGLKFPLLMIIVVELPWIVLPNLTFLTSLTIESSSITIDEGCLTSLESIIVWTSDLLSSLLSSFHEFKAFSILHRRTILAQT